MDKGRKGEVGRHHCTSGLFIGWLAVVGGGCMVVMVMVRVMVMVLVLVSYRGDGE